MGRVFRKVVTRPVPSNAVIENRQGRRHAKWTPRGARRPLTAEVIVLDDGREVIRQEGGTYFARFRDGSGIVREVSTGCRDKAAAEQRLADLERQAERIRAGVMTEREATAADRMREPLDGVIEEYADRIPGKRGGPASPVHRRNVATYLRRLAAGCGWKVVGDLDRDDLERWMLDEQRKGRSARSLNTHRAAAVAFANWLAEPHIGRLPSNPFGTGRTAIRKADEDADPRRKRRALTPDELHRLVEAARNAPGRPRKRTNEGDTETPGRPPQRLTGAQRADLYVLLAGTGLRIGEVKAMKVADCRLDDAVPHVRVPAATAKSRRDQTVPLRRDLVELLRRYVEGKGPGDEVIPIPQTLIARFNADCRRAGIPKRDEDHRTIDVHCLRHTFGTMLSRAGVPPRVAMELLRHSSIALTMKTYTDPRLFDLVSAVESIASVPSVPPSVPLPGGIPGHSGASSGTNDREAESTQTVIRIEKKRVS